MITRDRTVPSPAQEESMAKLPKPGQPVRGSRSGAPIMALFDLLGRRWAMGVRWTLSEGGAMTFRELQERCETISPSVMKQRLRELKEAGIVRRTDRGQIPTALGERIYRTLTTTWTARQER